MRPSKGTHDDERETTDVTGESLQSVDTDDFRMWWEQGLAPTAAKGRWKLTAKGRALVGVVAIVGSVLALKGCAPSSDFFAYNDPAHSQFPALSGKDNAQSAQGKIAKEQLDDLSTQASLPRLPASRSGDVPRIQPTAGVSNAMAVAPKVDTSTVASLSVQPSSGAISRSKTGPDSTIDVRGDGRRAPLRALSSICQRNVLAKLPTGSWPAMQRRPPPVRRQTPRVNCLPSQQSLRRQMRLRARNLRSSLLSLRRCPLKPPSSLPIPCWRPLGICLARGLRPPNSRSIRPPPAPTGWAVQLAASKSEDEAKNDLKRLNARYASALNGSTVRLHKARVGGETVYRLRVFGLSKADAATLCERLKGGGGSCFIVR